MKTFAFDLSLWSHYDMENEPGGEGTGQPGRPNVDQQYLYEVVGAKLLENYWEGYDVCLFAYGQSGAGKSFSMTGKGPGCALKWQGMIPRICRGVFENITSAPPPDDPAITIKYDTNATMLEIYLGKIYDLLIAPEKYNVKTRTALEMQLDDVAGLTPRPVGSTEDVAAVLTLGFTNQYKAPTGLNVDSSRGHTIFSLQLDKTITNSKAKKVKEREQKIRTSMKLVDLAGSERSTKVTEIDKPRLQGLLQEKYKKAMTVTDEKFQIYISERLEEGKHINGSLSNLGKCVGDVAKYSGIEDEKERTAKLNSITWRVTALTRILKSALNGRCKTVMIAAVSPSHSEYPETISTMGYANEIKKIKSCAVKKVAVETQEQILQRKIKELEAALAARGPGGGDSGGGGGGGAASEEVLKQLAEMKRQEEEARRREMELAKEMEALREATRAKEATKRQPHLLAVLPEDTFLTPLPEGKEVVGGHQSLGCALPLLGMGISRTKIHCTFLNENGKITFTPETGSVSMVNGRTVKSPVVLNHSDRLRLGSNNYFRLVLPEGVTQEQLDNEELHYTYEFVKDESMREALEAFGAEEDREAEEKRKKAVEEEVAKFKKQQEEEKKRVEEERLRFAAQMQQLQLQMQNTAQSDKAELERIAKEKADYEAKLVQMREKEELLNQKLAEEEKARKEKYLEEERAAKKRATAKAKLQYDLVDAIQFVRTSNEYAAELNIPVAYEITIVQEATDSQETIASVAVVIKDTKSGKQEQWDMDTFRTKYGIIMQEYHDNSENIKAGRPVRLGPDSAFRVSGTAIQTLGWAKCILSYVYQLVGIDDSYRILSSSASVMGSVTVKAALVWEDEDQQDEADACTYLDEVKGLTHIDLDLEIVKCEALDPKYACNIECSLEFPDFVGTSIVDVEGEALKKKAREVKALAKKHKKVSIDDDDDDEDAAMDYDEPESYVFGATYKTEPIYPGHDSVQINPQIGWKKRIRIHNLNKRIFEWLSKGSFLIKVRGCSPRTDAAAVTIGNLASAATSAAAAAANALAGPPVEVRVGGKTAQELHDELQKALREREDINNALEQAKKAAAEAQRQADEIKQSLEDASKKGLKDAEKQQQAVVEAVRQGKVSADAELKKELLRLQEEAKQATAASERYREDAKNKAIALERILAGGDLKSVRSKITDVILPDAVQLASTATTAAVNAALAQNTTASSSSQPTEGKVNTEMTELRLALQEERRRLELERKRAQKAESDLKAFKDEWDNDGSTKQTSSACTIL